MSTPEPKIDQGAIPALVAQADRARHLAAKDDVAPGLVKIWNGTTRACLRNAFGPDSPIVSSWPNGDAAVPREQARELLMVGVARLEHLVSRVTDLANAGGALGQDCVFLGHGRSPLWRELKDFLADRLRLPWEEFNRESVAGIPTTERLQQMLERASFALLVLTAEDEHADASLHARENVIHEVGLFQGRLGARRAIVLLEEGCEQFSNIHGLTHISFPKGRMSAAFEDIRRVLEREGILRRA